MQVVGIVETYGEGEVSVVLEEQCHCSPKIDQLEGLDIFSVNEDFTFGGVVDSGNELEDGTFARAVGSDDHLKNISSEGS